MEIGRAEQETIDFDWFGVDQDGFVGHFTTAGFKHLPRTVAMHAEDLERVTDYFRKHAPTTGGHRVSADLGEQIPQWQGESREGRYLDSFVTIADKGLYSFDIDTYLRSGLAYFCVAAPMNPIRLADLPEAIRTIVERTKLKGILLRNCSRIAYESTLEM